MSVTHTVTGGSLYHLSGNPIEIIVTASATRVNHKLAVKIKCADLLSPEQVEEIEPTNLISKFTINGLVDEPIELNLTYPATGNANPYTALVRNVTFEIGEVWDDVNGDRTEEWTVIADVLKIIDGKLRQHELATLNQANKTFYSEYIQAGKFLTNQPQIIKVSPTQLPRLWYQSRFADNHVSQINLKITTNQRVLTLSEEKTFYTTTGLIELVVQPDFWGFTDNYAQPGEYVVSYEFWITDVGGDISEHRFFNVDLNYHRNNYVVSFRNPCFSIVENIWLYGSAQENHKTETETSFTPVPVGSGTMKASLTTISAKGNRSWTINTGLKSRAERLALRDLLEAKERWIQDPDDSSILIPVHVEGGEFLLHDTASNIAANMPVVLTFIESHVN